MSTELYRHGCGGTLHSASIQVTRPYGHQVLGFTVEGLVCDRCRTEVIERDVAARLEQAFASVPNAVERQACSSSTTAEPVSSADSVVREPRWLHADSYAPSPA
jgi:hypothetical protein